jgi:hypothetical protein
MIPLHTRVAAIDDNEDHLQKIVWGLGKAGFCPIPFYFDDGKLEVEPPQPLPGIRIVFTDIHLTFGGANNEKTHAANIIRCLKKIVGNGPYALIFWSQFPGDADAIAALIAARAGDAGLTPPIGHAAVDKNEVFKVTPENGDDAFDAAKLRDLILDRIKGFKTLAVASSWEERAAQAAARTTNRLFELVKGAAQPADEWEGLLAYLACEAVGVGEARMDLTKALDSALLPLLEDQLALMGTQPAPSADDVQRLMSLVSVQEGPPRPASIAVSYLNASYLIEEVSQGDGSRMWDRGMVYELSSAHINSGPFARAFGHVDSALIRQEFATRDLNSDERQLARLHVVELGPECDHVQGKMVTHRYLLALLVPAGLLDAFVEKSKKKSATSVPRYRNDSILDIGEVALRNAPGSTWHLLISCRSFMTLAARTEVEGRCRFRLRRALLEEVVHRYVTHARRPGVMRFRA